MNKTENELRRELEQFMNKNSFTANRLSLSVGCHPQTITNWINKEKSIKVDTLESIHKFMNKY